MCNLLILSYPQVFLIWNSWTLYDAEETVDCSQLRFLSPSSLLEFVAASNGWKSWIWTNQSVWWDATLLFTFVCFGWKVRVGLASGFWSGPAQLFFVMIMIYSIAINMLLKLTVPYGSPPISYVCPRSALYHSWLRRYFISLLWFIF